MLCHLVGSYRILVMHKLKGVIIGQYSVASKIDQNTKNVDKHTHEVGSMPQLTIYR